MTYEIHPAATIFPMMISDAEYLQDFKTLDALRRAWGQKKAELAIDTETKIGESDCVVVENGVTEGPPGKPV